MAKTSTVTRTSAHHELKLVSTLLNEDGVDLKDISLMLLLAAQAGPGVSTIRRRRKSTVSEAADMMRMKIKSYASFDLKLFSFTGIEKSSNISQVSRGCGDGLVSARCFLMLPNFSRVTLSVLFQCCI